MTLVAFLQYAGTGLGINAIVGFILSFVVEWFPEYDGLSSRAKRLVMILLCFIVPVAALVGLVLLGDVGLSVDAVWVALSAGFSAFFGSQVAQVRQLDVKKMAAMSIANVMDGLRSLGFGDDEEVMQVLKVRQMSEQATGEPAIRSVKRTLKADVDDLFGR